jgi:hypothetical protein
MAHEFLNLAGRKDVPAIVRLGELQPGDFGGLFEIFAECFDAQFDEVFAPPNLEHPCAALQLRKVR